MMTKNSVREKLSRIIFYNDTKAGHRFDIIILWLIVLSVTMVILDSVDAISPGIHHVFQIWEWVFTILFTIEYLLRIYSAPDRWKYITSFFGIVDLLAIIPSYAGIFIPGTQQLLIVRILR